VEIETKTYEPLPTIKRFHESPAQIRAIVGEVGSGKTSGATMEVCYYLPKFLFDNYNIKRSRWVIIRNTYRELVDTTQRTVFEWFPQAQDNHKVSDEKTRIPYKDGYEVEILFRACDRPQDIKKLKSLELTGYWTDESIEVPDDIKRMLKNRIGRFPKKCPCRFGIETTNPPDVEHPMYYQFKWDTPPPGPVSEKKPLDKHIGFWQPPRENIENLRAGYYEDLRADYADNPDWIDVYLDGKPGIIVKGKLVYHNFRRDIHVAKNALIWSGGGLWRGWDNSGNTPACVVIQRAGGRQIQVLAEFFDEKMGIVDFGNYVAMECNIRWPDAEFVDWADPSGSHEYSTKEGGFTSNAKLMNDECNIAVSASEQNLRARIEAVDLAMGRIDGFLIDPNCTKLINGFLGGYCYLPLGTTGEYSEIIWKNKFSHVQDALQYAMVKMLVSPKRKTETQTQKFAISDYDEFSCGMEAS